MKPYERLPDSIEYDGGEYPLDLSYAAFFAVADVLEDDRLDADIKIRTALNIFVDGNHPEDPALLNAIYDLLKDDRPTAPPESVKTMDIEQDWEYICASFQQAYGIDLYSDKGIHILRFQALLRGLPKGTKLLDVIGIRTMKVPAPNGHNSEEISSIIRAKTVYALKQSVNFESGLAKLFDLLQARAK